MSWAGKLRRALLGPSTPHGLLAIAVLGFLLVTLIWPLLNVIATGFLTSDGRLTTDYLELVISDPVLLAGLRNALSIAGVSRTRKSCSGSSRSPTAAHTGK